MVLEVDFLLLGISELARFRIPVRMPNVCENVTNQNNGLSEILAIDGNTNELIKNKPEQRHTRRSK